MRHVPVLLSEVIESLQLKPGAKVVDCTLGDGGHSEVMLRAIGRKGTLLGIDVDPESLLRAKQYLYEFQDQVTFVRDNFTHVQAIASEHGFTAADAILIDLGWSSPQFAERGRGFSFEGDEPLDMRFAGQAEVGQYLPAGRNLKTEEIMTAASILNQSSSAELERIFKQNGEEHLAKEIAVALVTERKKHPIERTKQLVDIILQVYRTKLKSVKEVPWIGGIHPATKVFQALRIEVNQELPVLRLALKQATELLAPGGRLAVISFHSLEDRIVKHYFQIQANKTIKIITKKPIVASDEEVKINPKARSAKLRVVEKLVG